MVRETGSDAGLSGPATASPGRRSIPRSGEDSGRRATPRSGEESLTPKGNNGESGELAEVRKPGREMMVDAGVGESPAPPGKPLTPNEWETGTLWRIGGSSSKPRCQFGRGVELEGKTPKGVRSRRIGDACEGLGSSIGSRPSGTGRELTPVAPDPYGSSE